MGNFKDLKDRLVSIFDEILKEKIELEDKTEAGKEYPKEAYLYVPDPDKPSTWKLRIWETPEKKITRSQLGRAAAAFSPGGFRGQKVELPSDEVKTVKNKLISLYKKDGAEKDEIPSYLFEESKNEGGEDSMAENVKLEEFEKRLVEIEKEKKVLEDKYVGMIDSLKKEMDEKAKKAEETAKKLSDRENELHVEKVNAKINDLLSMGIWPAVAEKTKRVMLQDTNNKFGTIKLEDKDGSPEISVTGAIMEILSNIPKEARLSFEEKTNSSGKDEKKYMSEDEVLKYAKEHSITFGEACSILAKEGKLEFIRLS